jgi:hypothetical protein
MNMVTKYDLQNQIYGGMIKPVEIFVEFIKILDSIDSVYSNRAQLRTRGIDNKILHSSSIKYFTYVESSDKEKPETIFAGAIETPPRSSKVPVVRVRTGNRHLIEVPNKLIFPFERERNPGWTNIVISSDTIAILENILHLEVENYFLNNPR